VSSSEQQREGITNNALPAANFMGLFSIVWPKSWEEVAGDAKAKLSWWLALAAFCPSCQLNAQITASDRFCEGHKRGSSTVVVAQQAAKRRPKTEGPS